MHQLVFVQRCQSGAQRNPDLQALLRRQSPAPLDFRAKRFWRVGFRIDRWTKQFIISQLHYVIKVALWLIDPHVQDVHESFMGTRDWFEPFDSGQFALESTFLVAP